MGDRKIKILDILKVDARKNLDHEKGRALTIKIVTEIVEKHHDRDLRKGHLSLKKPLNLYISLRNLKKYNSILKKLPDLKN